MTPGGSESHILCQTHVPHLGCPFGLFSPLCHLSLRLRSSSNQVTIRVAQLRGPAGCVSPYRAPARVPTQALSLRKWLQALGSSHWPPLQVGSVCAPARGLSPVRPSGPAVSPHYGLLPASRTPDTGSAYCGVGTADREPTTQGPVRSKIGCPLRSLT